MTLDKKEKRERRERKRLKLGERKRKKKKRGRKKRIKRHYIGENRANHLIRKNTSNTIEKKFSDLCDYTDCEFIYLIRSKCGHDSFSGFTKNLKLPFLFLNIGILLQEILDKDKCDEELKRLYTIIDKSTSQKH